jgi:hypothetical protein
MMRFATAIVVAAACVGATVAHGQPATNDPAAITPFAGARAPAQPAPADTTAPDPATVVAGIFRVSCGRCHGTDRPATALSLRAETFADAMIDVPSREIKELRLVDTSEPEKSYLLMKLRGDAGIIGEVMPLGGKALEEWAIAAVEAWVGAVSAAADTAAPKAPARPDAAETPDAPEAPDAHEAADAQEAPESPDAPDAEEAPDAEKAPRAPEPAQGS